jgi:hypothetical protein
MIRVVANLLLLQIPSEFIGNAHTIQIRAYFLYKRRDLLKRPAHESAELS